MPVPCVAVIGEALVDEFQDGPVPGGAPFNVARSLAGLGAPVAFVSRIAAGDAPGQLLRDSARRYGLSEVGLQLDPTQPTGRVRVVEHAGGGHAFEIQAPAAWDFIQTAPAQALLAQQPAGWLYFGTLAQRHATSRATVRALVQGFAGRRLLDLNLRPGTDTRELAEASLALADWVKLNDDELAQLAAWLAPDAPDEARQVSALMTRFQLDRVVLTRGAEGWRLHAPEGRVLAQGPGVRQPALQDTVGAGDAFTALLLAGLALRRDLHATLALANRYAAFICGVRGPLPADPLALQPWRTALHALPTELSADLAPR
ncbi:PfkB family carbohydrate kinase [Roseateles sp. BYS87W]|uniref:PfkB family carbohydrate kinase n=1 Tax=Pelomonas baiyunensis TaxID=3299026 RepID=A0ABW7H3V3_9BURK